MIREADIDGDGQVNYEGKFETPQIYKLLNLLIFSEFVTMMTSKWFVKLCRCEKLTTGCRWLVGGGWDPTTQTFILSKILPKFANFQFGQTPLRATSAKILHFSAFCLHVMPSLLPLSPLLGPMVSILEHLCLQKNTLNHILENFLNIKNTKTLRCLCLKTFPVFLLFIFNN